ncbi:MAG: tRNA epoxyqueuosine(34) reductase QueG [Planctomycetales bacterium]|nr:tRNA epoxyqueuosine(34) reductase QueG [Planctomycetales bacterium]
MPTSPELPKQHTPSLTTALKTEARRLGFDLAGACPAVTPAGIHRFGEWLAAGYAGQMHYLADRDAAYAHPRAILEGARSLLMLAMNYRTAEPQPAGPGEGQISRYAWGTDYHDTIHARLKRLVGFLQDAHPDAAARGVVDTAPLLEREFAQLAGLGWIGKNTLLLNREQGSWFFLAALITDVQLEYDAPHEADHCGTCTACLDACPTDAFVAPYLLDARRCLSYLTIELRDAVPHDLRDRFGHWVFGCDVCQEVCPWNGKVPTSDETTFQPNAGANPAELRSLFELDDDAFRRRFRHTPLWRARRRGVLRNAAIVLGQHPSAEDITSLARGLCDDEPIVRGACAWALGRAGDVQARRLLVEQSKRETSADVREEITRALEKRT